MPGASTNNKPTRRTLPGLQSLGGQRRDDGASQ